MSFGKNLFVFVSGAVVGAGALAGFAGWQMYKALKKNDILYTAVRSSVDAGVKAASSEFSEHGAKAVLNMVFGKPNKCNKISYEEYYYGKHRNNRIRDIEFSDLNRATDVLSSIKGICHQFGSVTIADVYDICNMAHEYDSRDYHYGWKNADELNLTEHGSNYWGFNFPTPIKLEGFM